MPGLTKKVVDEWLTRVWEDGYSRGVEGDHSLPNFSEFDPRAGSKSAKDSLNPHELSIAPFDVDRCEARVWNHGWGKQCHRKHGEDNPLCNFHLKIFNDIPSGFDLGLGRVNQPRPPCELCKPPGEGKIHKWKDLQSDSIFYHFHNLMDFMDPVTTQLTTTNYDLWDCRFWEVGV